MTHQRGESRDAFVARALASRDKARRSGRYVSSEAVVGRLEKMLAGAKAAKSPR
jgi:hypothetical protein